MTGVTAHRTAEEINMPNGHRDTPEPRKAAIFAASHADGPSWTRCRPACVQPHGRQAHCPVDNCHHTFTTVSNFDKHRRNGRCLDLATIGMAPNAWGLRTGIKPAECREMPTRQCPNGPCGAGRCERFDDRGGGAS